MRFADLSSWLYCSSPRLKSLVTICSSVAVAAETPPLWHDCCHIPPLPTAINIWVPQVVCREVPPQPELKSSDPFKMLFATVMNVGGSSECREGHFSPQCYAQSRADWDRNMWWQQQQNTTAWITVFELHWPAVSTLIHMQPFTLWHITTFHSFRGNNKPFYTLVDIKKTGQMK